MVQNKYGRITHGILLLILVGLVGCTGVQPKHRPNFDLDTAAKSYLPETDREKVRALQNDLTNLDLNADRGEAKLVAETAIGYSHYLAREYGVVRPAVLHNVFVRLGFKDRGLCYHWTEDLLNQLRSLKLKTYQLYWGVAHRGSQLREHNSVVITVTGQRFASGIVLDPWRHSGDLYWARVETDRYPWQERPRSEW